MVRQRMQDGPTIFRRIAETDQRRPRRQKKKEKAQRRSLRMQDSRYPRHHQKDLFSEIEKRRNEG